MALASKKVQTSFRLDPDLLRQLQHTLVQRGKSMNAVLEELVGAWVGGGESAPPGSSRGGPMARRESTWVHAAEVPLLNRRSEEFTGELEHGYVSDDYAVSVVAAELNSGGLELEPFSEGRAHLVANEDSCMLANLTVLAEINRCGWLAVATLPRFSFARRGERVSTVKVAPFRMAQNQVEAVTGVLKASAPVLQAIPIRDPIVAVLYCDGFQGERALRLLEQMVAARLQRVGTRPQLVLAVREDRKSLARALERHLRARPTLVWLISTTIPPDPSNVAVEALHEVGCRPEPVAFPATQPFLLAYAGSVPVVLEAGVGPNAQGSAVDALLPGLLAGYRFSATELAQIGRTEPDSKQTSDE